MSPNPRVLFVDDDPRVLSGLRRQLHGRRGEWELAFAAGGPEALRLLGSGPWTAVVCDMRMPFVDGAQVLAHLAYDQPRAARLVLSGDAQRGRRRQALGSAHRYLVKPCATALLTLEIGQAVAVRGLLDGLCDPRLERVWRQPPGFLPEGEGVLAALREEHTAVSEELLVALRSSAELWPPLRAALLAALAGRLDPAAGEAALVSAAGARLVLALAMAVRLLETFGGRAAGAGRATALAGARRAAAVAGREDTEAERVDAIVVGLLAAGLGPERERSWWDVLAWLLPAWGFSAGVVRALTAAPRTGDAGLGPPLGRA